jgi:hypothetical protein
MRDQRRLLASSAAVAVAGLLTLAACAPAEPPDLRDAQRQAQDFVDAAMTSDGALAVTSGVVGPRRGDGLDDSGITVGFPEPVIVDDVEVVCFGGGEARLAVSVVAADGASNSVTVPVPCDGEPRQVGLPQRTRGVSDVSVNSWLERGEGGVLATVVQGSLP